MKTSQAKPRYRSELAQALAKLGYRELMTAVARVVEHGKAKGEVRPEVDADAVAFQLMAVGEGSLVLWAIGLGTAKRQRLLESEFDIFWRGMATPAGL